MMNILDRAAARLTQWLTTDVEAPVMAATRSVPTPEEVKAAKQAVIDLIVAADGKLWSGACHIPCLTGGWYVIQDGKVGLRCGHCGHFTEFFAIEDEQL